MASHPESSQPATSGRAPEARRLHAVAVRTSLVVWVGALIYIVLSDRAVEAWIDDPELMAQVQTIKGWAFITLMSLVLYLGLRSQLRRWEGEARERRRAEDALRTRMAQLQAVFARQPLAFFACDAAGVITLWEGRSWPEVQFPPTDVIGRRATEVLGGDPGVQQTLSRAFEGEAVAGELRLRTRTFEIFHTPLTDSAGRSIGTSGVVLDITERKKLEAQLLRAQRLESVGRLAGGVAHDLNNILSPVLIGVGLLRARVNDPDGVSLLDTIKTSAERGAGIIRQLLMFSRGAAGEIVPVTLQALVNDMRALVRETFPKNIALRMQGPTEPVVVQGDPTQLHQVLMNLCVNARDAMPEGGRLTITIDQTPIDDEIARRNPGVAPGAFAQLTVQDTGTGIAPEHLDQIFDPFFTTKEPGTGTGLGLSTVMGIVRSHRGFIQVQSTPGEGSTFQVFLPLGSTSAVENSPAHVADMPQGAGESVLVVDDEPSVRRMVRRALELYGYHVHEAEEGAQALAFLGEAAVAPGVIVTDLTMPVQDGPAFVRALRERGIQVPVVAMTGAGDARRVDELRSCGVELFLGKPFTTEALVQAVHRALESRAR